MILDGRYEIGDVEGEVSQRGKHHTLTVRDIETGEALLACALKPQFMTDASTTEAFIFGVEQMRKLEHPSTIKIVASQLDRDRGDLAYVTPRVNGSALSKLLRDGEVFSEREVRGVGITLLEALEHAHGRGVVFGNVKSNNIVIEASRERAIIVGLPKPPFKFFSILQLGAYIGLPHECPPELLKEGSFGQAADIYGVGLVMYEMCTGRDPSLATPHLAEIFGGIIDKPLPSLASALPGITPRLERLIMRAVDKDPGKRPESAAVMRSELESIMCPANALVVTDKRLREIVTGHYPFPIAEAYRSIDRQVDESLRLGRIVDTAHVCIQFLAFVAIGDLMVQNEKPALPRAISRPSLGHWAQILREARHIGGSRAFPSVQHLYTGPAGDITPTGRIIESLVKMRNEVRHGATITSAAARKKIEQGTAQLDQMLKGTLFLKECCLFVPKRLNYRKGSFLCTAWCFEGSESVPLVRDVRIDQPLTLDHVHIADKNFQKVVTLHPFIIFDTCRICEEEEIFFYESASKGRIHYISFSKGHEIFPDRPSLYPPGIRGPDDGLG